MSLIEGWESFYVVAGTAAATLTGLMFVVITLIAGSPRRTPNNGIGIYSTPTVVHFAAALMVTLILSAPWPQLWEASIPLGALGIAGLVYGGIVLRRTLATAHNEFYQPVLEDWLCHAILPLTGYAALLLAAIILTPFTVPALFIVGSVVVLYIVLGVHNAWDIVTYLTLNEPPPGE